MGQTKEDYVRRVLPLCRKCWMFERCFIAENIKNSIAAENVVSKGEDNAT